MKLAILFDRFGPYHIARVSGAMKFAEVLAVEGAPHRAVYDWVPPDRPQGLKHVVLAAKMGEEIDVALIERRLDEMVGPFKPDAIALPGWSNTVTLVALRWARNRQVPSICMSETNAWDFKRKPIVEAIKRGVVAHYQSGLATNSSQMDYLAQLGIPRAAIFGGYNAIDNDYFRVKSVEWRRGSKLPLSISVNMPNEAKGRYFLASSRFIPKKNILRLLDAYSVFRATRSDDLADWPLVLLGDGEMRKQIEAKVDQLALQSHVYFPGFLQIEELVGYYGTAGGFIHASTTEQWGLVINEAMASGILVAASNRCGASQFLIEDGVTGFDFDPFEISEITRALQEIVSIRDPSRLLIAAKNRVDELSPENFGRKITYAARAAIAKNQGSTRLFDRLALDLAIARAERIERS